MEASPEVRLVVKHTFLEFVEDAVSPCEPSRQRSLTDSAVANEIIAGRRQHQPLARDAGDSEDSPACQELAANTSPHGLDLCVNQNATQEVKAVLGLMAPQGRGNVPLFPGRPEQARPVGSPAVRRTSMQQAPQARRVRRDPPQLFEPVPDSYAAVLPVTRGKAGRSAKGSKAAAAPPVPEERSQVVPGVPDDQLTTVLFRNLPRSFTREMFLELVDSEGFVGTYNFVYTPVDFSSQAGLGYAFINFTSPAVARLFWDHFDGYEKWTVPNDKAGTLNWSSPHQGLAAHLERYRNSPVMHNTVPDEWKPAVFLNGVRANFPPPTKALKAPKIRHPVEGGSP